MINVCLGKDLVPDESKMVDMSRTFKKNEDLK